MKITGELAAQGFHAFDTEPHSQHGHTSHKMWLVVANSEQAHIYRKTEGNLELIAEARPGGGAGTASFDGHFFEVYGGAEKYNLPLPDRKKFHGQMAFIHSLIEWLEMANNEYVFDQLVLVADPKTLGHIRTSLSKATQARVITELDKDLTKLPLKEIQEHLDRVML